MLIGAGAGIGIALIGVIVVAINFATKPPPPRTDLPEWFDPAYRIKKNRGIIFRPEPSKARGKETTRRTDSTPKYTEEWLEKNFTHYVDRNNAFIWTNPKIVYPSNGKILAGVKVIAGERVNDLVLICTVTADGRPENMYLQSELLKDRSLGPPPLDDDE
jgi:hypothetical protein